MTDRKYDAMIGGFPSPDRLWEADRSRSPYVYCANNPLGMTDPGGMQGKAVQTAYDEEGHGSSVPAEKKGSVVGRVVGGAMLDAAYGILKTEIDLYFPVVPIYELASGPKKYVGGYVTAFENATGQNGGEEAARFWLAQGIAVAATYGAVKVAGMRGPVDVKLLQEGKPEAKQFAPTQLDKHFAKHGSEWGEGNITKMSYEKRAKSLLNKNVGGDIEGAKRANGDVLRYNVRTNEFATMSKNGTIRTLFRPYDGVEYWTRIINPTKP